MMKKNFEYIEIEEGKSQYEEYDLTETFICVSIMITWKERQNRRLMESTSGTLQKNITLVFRIC